VPEKASASLIWISSSPLMLIALFPTKDALNATSGISTFCPNAFTHIKQAKEVIKYLIVLKHVRYSYSDVKALTPSLDAVNL
jgi:hypothetical protein